MTNLRLINLENQMLTLRNQSQNNFHSQAPVHMVPPQPIFHATQTITPNQWMQQAQPHPFFHHGVPAPPPYMYRQSDRIPEASRQAQRPNINQQVQQAQMFNPLPSELVTQIPTSDSNNCIAVDQTSSQQFLFNQSYRNQGKGNVESNMKFKVTEDVDQTVTNWKKIVKTVEFFVRIKNVMEKAPNSSIQDRHSTVSNLPHDSHQNIKFISSATTNSKNCFAVKHMKETKNSDNYPKAVQPHPNHPVHSFNSNKNYFNELLDKHDIILLQEHWLFNYEKEQLKQHHSDFLTFSRHIDDDEPMSPIGRPRGHGGIAILYRKSMSSMFSQLPDGNNRVQAIEISTTGNPTCLINVYLPSRGTDSGHDAYRAALDTLKEIILKYQETHSIIIAGDFNASFIRHYKDSQDELFKQFCKENGIELPAKYPTDHTYFQGTSRSQIDYILVKFIENNMRLKELIQVKILREGHNTSDHYPVSADLCIELSASQKQLDSKRIVRSIQRQQSADKRNQLHEEIMKASDRDNELFFRLIKTQRSSSSQFTHILQTPDKEASTPDDINELFKEHFANLAKTNENPFFDKEHDNLVKLDAETIQGVKQGGILSANFYKAYNKNIIDTPEATNIGFKIGTNYLGCPTCADDIMLCATSEQDASTQLRIIESCTKNDRVKINSKKNEILLINKKSKELNLELFNEKISEKQTIKHLGIERQDRNSPNVVNRISTARATMYSLMGAGLHGINGVNPLISYKLWRTFVIPRMLYGFEILILLRLIF
ncbi:unnamed protein product [Mytilus edulis]|uniref:Endonuclease/exonuclease/phosphatase domain-containing protein n=1 Tax=Mytilus edulis TaxID=6550 RepID=A0A8S3USL6_MYTED|nr:unnamed protein product [Mytilus edulis]